MDCKCLPGCPFFNDRMDSMPSTANIMKKKYCQGSFESCARFMIFSKLGKPAVPTDLFPNEVEKAKSIIG
ncbi:hypothetical protein KKF34_09110 [Myxococcota bacterium]|nr:hypothetical protein [Myxococcota bacterium]MBU1380893.1 hypothetical protein [Myxococcota bacterium]MBU1497021.1 hypothetical protein [Myxococcota bacterium]